MWNSQKMSNKLSSEAKVRKHDPREYKINILTIRHRKDWVCRIDLRRTFGINPRDVSITALGSAINQAAHYMSLHPLEQVEVYFRKGTYRINAGEKPGITLKHFKPENNGRFILSGAGEWEVVKIPH